MAACGSDDELDSMLIQACLQYEAETKTTTDDDNDLDGILLEASLQFEGINETENVSRFTVVSDADILKDIGMSIPVNTRKQTNWCHNVWRSWRESRIKQGLEYPPPLLGMSDEQICKWLAKFLYEARRQDGTEYGGESLYQLFCGIQRFLRVNGRPEVDFLTDSKFRTLKNTLDARMKSLTRAGVGVEKNRSEPISVDEEEMLWSEGMLGDSSSGVLRDTMIYMCGLYFALRGGVELRQLTRKQLSIRELSNGDRYIQYQELMGSKNNQGGIHHRKVVNKVVPHFENKENPSRCFIRLYEKYVSKCPPDPPGGAFFLHSLNRPTTERWYSNRVVGYNALSSTVKRLCSAAGIVGKKTNHSLRATAATRLYRDQVDEQLIMDVTGHRSVEGIRSYKRTSADQFKDVSQVLHCNGKENETAEPVKMKPNASMRSEVPKTAEPVKMKHNASSDMNSLHGLCFNECNNITIHINQN